MPTWPASLPDEPMPQSLVEKPPNLMLRTEMDAGPAKVRRRYTAGVTTFEFTHSYSPAEMTIWISFYENDINHGTTSFTFPHPRKWGETIEARLTEPPEYKHLGAGYYEVSFKIEALP